MSGQYSSLRQIDDFKRLWVWLVLNVQPIHTIPCLWNTFKYLLTSNYSRIKIVDISIRIEIVPIFDFQINVHIHVEEQNQQSGVTLF